MKCVSQCHTAFYIRYDGAHRRRWHAKLDSALGIDIDTDNGPIITFFMDHCILTTIPSRKCQIFAQDSLLCVTTVSRQTQL